MVISNIAFWLSRKTGTSVRGDYLKLSRPSGRQIIPKHIIETAHWDEGFPILHAIRYSHPDNEVSGRRWITEIGIRQNKGDPEIECSIVLKIDAVSSRVSSQITASRPLFVYDLMEYCNPSERSAGRLIINLNEDNAVEFKQFIENPRRIHPIVIVSPTSDRRYLVEPKDIFFQVRGIADVVQIDLNADTFEIQDILGTKFAAWRGACNLIFPEIRGYIPTIKLMPDELNLMALKQEAPLEILSILTHKMNIPNSRQQITLQHVLEMERRFELNLKRIEARKTGELDEYSKLLELEIEAFNNKINEIRQEKEQLEDDVDALEDQARQLKLENDSLKLSYDYARAKNTDKLFNDDIHAGLIQVINRNASLSDALLVIETIFPERVVILNTAYESAIESRSFKYREEAFDLLWKLVTNYWEALRNGSRGDVEARNVFGKDEYAAKESESVTNSDRAKKLRTFTYKGIPVVMWKHLKHGVKDSVEETLRIHFHWDAEDNKIIIGHCGSHLDHR